MTYEHNGDRNRGHYPSPNDIVIFQPEFDEFGGEERVILALSRELYAQGKAHSVLCYQDQIGLQKYASWPLNVYALNPGSNPFRKIRSLRECLVYLHQQGSPVPILFNIQSAYHAGVGVNTPYHLRIPDTYSFLGKRPQEEIEITTYLGSLWAQARDTFCHYATARGIRRSNQFITNTLALRDEMNQLYNRRAEVIYLGGFGRQCNDRQKHLQFPVELLTVSRLETNKRIDWILKVLAEIRADPKYPECRLHVVGTGHERDALEKMSDDLRLSEVVVFHGFVTDEQLQKLYEKCHLFMLPAWQGYGLPAIESLYMKLGLVVSEDSGVVEILENTNSISIFGGGIAEFAAAAKEMLLRLQKPDFYDTPQIKLPSEQSWAREMIRVCGW